MNQVKYYEPIKEVRVTNFWQAMSIIGPASLIGQNVKMELGLLVEFSAEEDSCWATCNKEFGRSIETDERSPYRKGSFSLGGRIFSQYGPLGDIFAFLVLNLKAPNNPTTTNVTFSPVPFGPNGKPMLPRVSDKNQLKKFLWFVGRILLAKQFSLRGLLHELECVVNPRAISWVTSDDAEVFVRILCNLGALKQISNLYEVCMAPSEFAQIFDVDLGPSDPPRQWTDPINWRS
ncbi:MAG: hypothetical protein NTW11_04145 [Candidatus Staskawiczbacteria bacterium]|nr:hypothetical protein [Candidatus Staskawiczbacteria bacterium]